MRQTVVSKRQWLACSGLTLKLKDIDMALNPDVQVVIGMRASLAYSSARAMARAKTRARTRTKA